MQLPSASNTAGTLIGTLAGTATIAALPALPFVITAAAALSMTPVGLASIAAIGVTALVNYAATHCAEVANLNELVKEYWPQVQAKYPTGKNGQ